MIILNTTEEILQFLDDIDTVVFESECLVVLSLTDAYIKSAMFMENYDGDISSFELFQEAKEDKPLEQPTEKDSVWKKAAGSDNENMFKRILLYIPRLIKEFWNWLFKDDNKSSNDTTSDDPKVNAKKKKVSKKTAEKAISNLTTIQDVADSLAGEDEIEAYENQINKQLPKHITVNIDRDTHKVKFSHSEGMFGYLMGIPGIIDKCSETFNTIKEDFDPKDSGSVGSIVNKIKDIKDHEAFLTPSTAGVMLDDLVKIVKDVFLGAATLTGVGAAAASALDVRIKNMEAQGSDTKMMQGLRDIASGIMNAQNFLIEKTGPLFELTNAIGSTLNLLKPSIDTIEAGFKASDTWTFEDIDRLREDVIDTTEWQDYVSKHSDFDTKTVLRAYISKEIWDKKAANPDEKYIVKTNASGTKYDFITFCKMPNETDEHYKKRKENYIKRYLEAYDNDTTIQNGGKNKNGNDWLNAPISATEIVNLFDFITSHNDLWTKSFVPLHGHSQQSPDDTMNPEKTFGQFFDICARSNLEYDFPTKDENGNMIQTMTHYTFAKGQQEDMNNYIIRKQNYIYRNTAIFITTIKNGIGFNNYKDPDNDIVDSNGNPTNKRWTVFNNNTAELLRQSFVGNRKKKTN